MALLVPVLLFVVSVAAVEGVLQEVIRHHGLRAAAGVAAGVLVTRGWVLAVRTASKLTGRRD